VGPDRQRQGDLKLKNYQSEATQFIQDFLHDNPQVVEKQRSHRATWWDRPQNLEERAREEQDRVPQKGYAYYHNP
jgi:hypothetical protein